MGGTGRGPLPPAGYEAFFAAQHAPLARLAYALTGSRSDAQDLAQEVLVRSFERWSTVGAYASPEAWARRVLVNLVYSRTRRRRTEAIGLQRLRPIAAPRDGTELSDAAEAFWAAVRTLPPRQAQAVALRYGADLPAVEVAQILDVDPGTVRAHLHAARARLSAVLHVDADDQPSPTAASATRNPPADPTGHAKEHDDDV
ncbi:MAG TPA: SigE family RNA polymerase sigma factor [Acidimicrobiales bacterium]|nr:SigE family RNA polymerase sigma factor [Acidimicrobiales bacterium]